MFWINTQRIIRSGYRNFLRSGFTSISSILVSTITLFVIASLIFVQATLNKTLTDIKEKVDVTVYFVPDADETVILDLQSEIEKLPQVSKVTYTTATQALIDFKDKHSNDYLTLQALDELSDNPLGASLNIKAHDPAQYETISAYFDNQDTISKGTLSIIDKIDYSQNKLVIDKLNSLIEGSLKLGFILALVLIIISLIITFNTIRLIIFMSRDEINVMKLVGADSSYIRGPFVVSGVIVGIISAIITILLFIPISIYLGNTITSFIGINLFTYFKQNFFQLLIILIIIGSSLGAVSSAVAIRRYLKK